MSDYPRTRTLWIRHIGAAALIISAACAPVQAQSTGAQRDASASGIARVLGTPEIFGRGIDRPALEHFYRGRNFQPAWSGNAAAERARRAALGVLAAAGEHGLDPRNYGVSTGPDGVWPVGAETAAQSDARLTDALLRYMRDLRSGQITPAAVFPDVQLPPQAYDGASDLQRALAAGDLQTLLADLPPPHPAYAALKAALSRYEAIAGRGGWPQIPAGPSFDAWSGDGRVATLRHRLAIEDPGFAADPPQPGELDRAVRRYQDRNGLDTDGRVGARTLASLNVTARQRADQIRVNMERWRWVPRRFEDRYVMVNVAEARLDAIENGTSRLSSRVIVGDRRHPTPIFRALATDLTVNPPWNVPLSIARAEILPKLRRDSGYLRKENMVLMNGPAGDPFGQTVNWRAVSAATFPFRIQQLPGALNALGALKFELPNRFDVYLHDTPATALFARVDRALSHGCIRVQEILPLASIALTGDAGEGLPLLREAIASAETRHVALPRPLPIYVMYWTAVLNGDGSIGFRDDLYRRDEQLIAILHRQHPEPYPSGPVASTGCRAQTSTG